MRKLIIPLLLLGNWLCGQSLLHYWNFNTTSSLSAHLAPSVSIVSGAGIAHVPGGISAIDLAGGTGQNFNVLNLNARNGDPSGNHLRFNDPIGGALVFSLPTTGYADVVIKYATRRSGSGAGTQIVEYSVNGTDFVFLANIAPANGDPTLQTLDFSGIPAADNNANFKIRFTFAIGSGGNVGNNRFDNFTLEGNALGGDMLPPTVAFSPLAGTVNVPANTQPTITFSEDLRLVNDAAIDNASVDALVELRQGSVDGPLVAFDATFEGRTITLVPTAPLANSTTFHVVVKANVIEDLSNNAIASAVASSFTTIPVQTLFQAGDLLFVAYQMNAVPNDDRIGILTLVDILPGTMINFTDAKYIDGTPAQCGGGFTWTAPAAGVDSGTVIVIYNDAQTASIGSLSGSGFGLSANGDQVIVYTGSNTTPNYITALSSNAWLASNASCNGSNSKLPLGLVDGTSAINLSTSPNNVAGNTVNAFYNGPRSGTKAQLTSAILNPANWVGTASGSAAQTWPDWSSSNPGTESTVVSFAKAFTSLTENAGSVTVTLNVQSPGISNVDLVVKPAPFSTASASDFAFASQSIAINAATGSTISFTFPITEDELAEQDEYLVLSLENAFGLTVNGSKYMTIFIRDNDRKAPVANKEIELLYTTSFKPNATTGSTCEIVVHDPASQRLFTTSAIQDRLDIADFSNPANIVLIKSVDMAPYGGITSVAVKNGLVAVASPNANEALDGSVVFFDTQGNFLKQVTVGSLPDMVTFSPDGRYVLTANEGQPNDAYTVDPEGSVSIIDLGAGIGALTQSNVSTLLFTAYNAQEASLIQSGVRKLKATSTLSQDFEPEYVSISPDSKKAWVTLQENNAIGTIDLETKSLTGIWPLGTKDMNAFGNGFDASDNSGVVTIANWPVKAFYIPDALANFTINGTTYLISANEGDEKEYAGLNERTTVGAATTLLDPTAFPQAEVLKANHNLGRLRMTNLNGDTDNDGDYDQLFVNGSRSFSIWNTTTQTQVYDSGDDLELITSQHPTISALFNADNEGNGFKSRSRAKGPEPEGVTVAQIGVKTFAFVALERVGGVMVYDVTDPANPQFVDYRNTRNLSSYGGDQGPEGIIYIAGKDSPNGKHYIAVANEISGTIAVFELGNAPERPLVSNFNQTLNEDDSLKFQANQFTSHFSDVNEDTLVKIKIIKLPSKGVLKLNGTTLAVNAEIGKAQLGQLVYKPFVNANGLDTLIWNGSDGGLYAENNAKVFFSIQAINDFPVAAVTSPAAGTSFAAGSTITITANATDVDSPVKKVLFYAGATLLGEDASAPYQFVWNNVPIGNFNLYVKSIDNLNATTTSTTVNVKVQGCSGSGSITREMYYNLPGSLISSLTSSSKYPNSPDLVTEKTSFEGTANNADNYGSRMLGYLCAPETGAYTFWIAADDKAELWLSTNADPASKQLIANVPQPVNPRAYAKYPSQKSISIPLVKGAKYFIMALHKEATLTDHISVGWTLPNGTFQSVIPGVHLSPWTGGVAAREADVEAAHEVMAGMNVSPVPAQDRVQVSFYSEMGGMAEVYVTDILSNEMTRKNTLARRGGNQVELSLDGLPSGLYLVHVINGDTRQTQKIVLEGK